MRHHEVVIVGAGFAGVGAAIELRRAGVTDLVVLDRGDDVGGTWRDNTYPGAACDVPSILYSFSFAQNPDWSRSFSPQPEIHAYLQRVTREFGVEPHLRLRTEVVDVRFDEATARWHITTERGRYSARFVISAVGGLSEPVTPPIPGLDTFPGQVFHTAAWDHDAPLDGKRVAVVGTGASAIQVVPSLARRVGALTLFQRTPAWIMPRHDRDWTRVERWLYRRFPALQRLGRTLVYWGRELYVVGFRRPSPVMRLPQAIATRHLHRQVRDPKLRRQLTPDYTIGCKRILISNDFYPALTRDHVELVDAGLAEVRGSHVVGADGTEREVDAIVFATGFETRDHPVAHRVHGRDGRTLADVWAGGTRAHLGTEVAGFPNLFHLVGPNTGLGHSSMVLQIESQVAYVVDAIGQLRGTEAAADVREEVMDASDRRVQLALEGTVWTGGGCASWYLDDTGRNGTLWPSFTFAFRRQLARYRLEDHELVVPARSPERVSA
ncbi:NAD(P)/FAD-dependent oxidoreductase [Nitriliruptoraceae bacterium ZYF776]|nr:NAD(P)/FAD-dependent oxidoreductase [Profundirhabdus halotolerans]